LKLKGHKVIGHAFDGEIALQKLENMKDYPDVVILDHRMPQKTGLLIAKEILNKYPKIIIIIISADTKIRSKVIKAGIHEFLEKPIDFNHLFQTIDRYLKNIK
jgi:DNA-binding NtrC family response regulator